DQIRERRGKALEGGRARCTLLVLIVLRTSDSGQLKLTSPSGRQCVSVACLMASHPFFSPSTGSAVISSPPSPGRPHLHRLLVASLGLPHYCVRLALQRVNTARVRAPARGKGAGEKPVTVNL